MCGGRDAGWGEWWWRKVASGVRVGWNGDGDGEESGDGEGSRRKKGQRCGEEEGEGKGGVL